jgi:lysophospholipase L1-like esterase
MNPAMKRSILLCFVLVFAVLNTTAQEITDVVNAKKEFQLLFVGNSLTYTNNLPKLVKKTAKQRGIDLQVKMLVSPDYAIVDHWKEGQVQKMIKSETFDFVIIQQGPSSQNEGRKMLMEDGKNYSDLCASHGARLCYFMVWPSVRYYQTFDKVIKNHQDAARGNKAILLPVGEVWKEFIDSTGSLEYYSPDGFHPSKKGSQVAAETIVKYLFPKMP